MADATWAAFYSENAAHFLARDQQVADRTTDFAMIEMLFIYQPARNPIQAVARRWGCLFRVSGTASMRGMHEFVMP
jgi:hypothetical protein